MTSVQQSMDRGCRWRAEWMIISLSKEWSVRSVLSDVIVLQRDCSAAGVRGFAQMVYVKRPIHAGVYTESSELRFPSSFIKRNADLSSAEVDCVVLLFPALWLMTAGSALQHFIAACKSENECLDVKNDAFTPRYHYSAYSASMRETASKLVNHFRLMEFQGNFPKGQIPKCFPFSERLSHHQIQDRSRWRITRPESSAQIMLNFLT